MKRNKHTTNARRQMQHRASAPKRQLLGQFVTAEIPGLIVPPPQTWAVASRQQIHALVQNALKGIA